MTHTPIHIEPRSAWGATGANGDGALNVPATSVAIHHTASNTLPATATVEQERAAMRALERTGIARFGSTISYHVVVFPSGRAYEGVSLNRRGQHVARHNSVTRGLAFAGNFSSSDPTPAALATALGIIEMWRQSPHVIHSAPTRPHSHWSATACPGRAHSALLAFTPNSAPQPAPAAPTPPQPAPAQPAPAQPAPTQPAGRTVEQAAREVIRGLHGTGHEQRRRSLGISQADYARVRAAVNALVAGRPLPADASRVLGAPASAAPAPAVENPVRTVAQMADEVIRGLHGVGHAARQRSLGVNAATYALVRAEVNRRLR